MCKEWKTPTAPPTAMMLLLTSGSLWAGGGNIPSVLELGSINTLSQLWRACLPFRMEGTMDWPI